MISLSFFLTTLVVLQPGWKESDNLSINIIHWRICDHIVNPEIVLFTEKKKLFLGVVWLSP